MGSSLVSLVSLTSCASGGLGRLIAVVLHGLYALLGWIVLRCARGPTTPCEGRVHFLVCAWAIGLALNLPVAFVLNQLLGLSLSPLLLLGSALALATLCAIPLLLRRGRSVASAAASRPRDADEPWSVWAVAALSAAAVVFARQHGAMLIAPLRDWDTFLYHLPYGRLVAAGAFPADIAPDYAHVAAAYPPLFYFIQGLNFHAAAAIGSLDLTYWMPKVTVTAVNAGLCLGSWAFARARLELGREAAAFAVLWLVLLLNWKTNIQSITALYFVLGLFHAWPTRSSDTLESPPARSRWAVLPGAILFAGCAWSNYTGVLLVGATIGALCVTGFVGGRAVAGASPVAASLGSPVAGAARRQRDDALWMGLVVFGLLLPFLLRNALVAGNPVYPAALETLGGVWVTPWWLENEGVLRNAPTTRGSATLAFHDARGAAPMLLAAFGALLSAPRLTRAVRLAFACVLAGFVGFWLLQLQPTWAVAWRHLQPVLPLAVGFAALPLDAMLRDGSARSIPVLLAWPVLLALTAVSPVANGALGFGVALAVSLPAVSLVAAARLDTLAVPRGAWRLAIAMLAGVVMTTSVDLDTISTAHAPGWVVAPWPELVLPIGIALGLGGAVALARRARGEAARGLGARQVGMLLAGLVGVAVTLLPRPVDPLGYRLDIRADIEWMNAHLPRRAVVLTLEDRLFTLERAHVQASHPSLEAFYVEPDDRASFEALRSRGITHVYHTRSPIFRRQRFFFDKQMLFPGPENPWVELMHQSPTGAVVRLRPPAAS